MINIIKSDLKRKLEILQGDGHKIGVVNLILSDGVSAMILYRLMRSCCHFKFTIPLAFIFQRINKLINQCMIGVNADFGPGFAIMHPVGVVINSAVRGGSNIAVESGVVIGSSKGLSPTLMCDIYIGAGAKILGGITIGNKVSIGANAVVVKDANDGEALVGIPARAIVKNK